MKTETDKWLDVADMIDAKEPQVGFLAYGISRSMASGGVLYVDCGNVLGDISMARIHFRDEKIAEKAYCKGIRLEIKVVENVEVSEITKLSEGRENPVGPPNEKVSKSGKVETKRNGPAYKPYWLRSGRHG
jgi:hypothetical protein